MTAPSGHDGAGVRAKVILALHRHFLDNPNTGEGPIADVVLAVVREHVMTEEAMGRCSISMGKLPSNYTRPQLYRAFLSAALGE